MRVLLVQPPFQRLTDMRNIFFPLPLGFLAAVLSREGFEVGIYDAEAPNPKEENYSRYLTEFHYSKVIEYHHRYRAALNDASHSVWKEVNETLHNFRPDVVGITCVSPKLASSEKIASLCKEYDDNCHVIVGGPHPTVEPGRYLANPSVDFVVLGEGEETLLELVRWLADPQGNCGNIDGLAYRHNGDVILTKPRRWIDNLDDIPNPAKNLVLSPEMYSKADMGHIVGARGCPYGCTFCGTSAMWGRRVRFKSAAGLFQEMTEVYEAYGTREFRFWDDPFTLNKERTRDFCEVLLAEGCGFRWRCSTRVDLVDDALLKLMKKAGCTQINVGIESGSRKILSSCKKGITLEDIYAAARAMHRNDIDWAAYIMIGFPDETEEDIAETMRLIRKIRPSTVKFSIVSPYPGTSLHRQLEEFGSISQDLDWNDISHLSPLSHFTQFIGRERFLELLKQVANEIDEYNSRGFSKRLFERRHYLIRHPGEVVQIGRAVLRNKIHRLQGQGAEN